MNKYIYVHIYAPPTKRPTPMKYGQKFSLLINERTANGNDYIDRK